MHEFVKITDVINHMTVSYARHSLGKHAPNLTDEDINTITEYYRKTMFGKYSISESIAYTIIAPPPINKIGTFKSR